MSTTLGINTNDFLLNILSSEDRMLMVPQFIAVPFSPATNLLVVSLTPVNSFSAVSMERAMNLRLFFDISDQYQRHRGKMLSRLLTTPAMNCCDDRGLFFLQNIKFRGKQGHCQEKIS